MKWMKAVAVGLIAFVISVGLAMLQSAASA